MTSENSPHAIISYRHWMEHYCVRYRKKRKIKRWVKKYSFNSSFPVLEVNKQVDLSGSLPWCQALLITLWVAKTSGLLWHGWLIHRITLYNHFAIASYSIFTQYWTDFNLFFVPCKYLDTDGKIKTKFKKKKKNFKGNRPSMLGRKLCDVGDTLHSSEGKSLIKIIGTLLRSTEELWTHQSGSE